MFASQVSQFFLWHLPISVVAIIGLHFAFRIFINQAANTTSIINYAFAIVIALASVSFGYARLLEENGSRLKAQYCGERFLHSALLFLVASVVKHFLLQDEVRLAYGGPPPIACILYFMGFLPGILFLGSLVNCIAGLRDLNSMLYERKRPAEELLKFF